MTRGMKRLNGLNLFTMNCKGQGRTMLKAQTWIQRSFLHGGGAVRMVTRNE